MSLRLALAAAAAAAFATTPARAAIDVTSPAFAYSQTFDSLAVSGGSNAWVNDGTLAGWSLFNGAGAAITTYAGDTGGSNAGAFKSFGTSGSTERALGGVASGGSYFGSPPSGVLAGHIALAFTNTTGGALNSFTLGFDGEQWRNGGNTTPQTMVLEYGFGSSFGGVAAWAAAGSAFDFTSPIATATAAAVDGNGAGLVAGLGGTVAVNWAAGDTLWLRWAEVNNTGNDHGLAIDNLAFSVTAVPEPGAAAMLLAGLAALGFVARRRA